MRGRSVHAEKRQLDPDPCLTLPHRNKKCPPNTGQPVLGGHILAGGPEGQRVTVLLWTVTDSMKAPLVL